MIYQTFHNHYGHYYHKVATVKPCPEAHMDMILFEVFFEEYPLDSTRSVDIIYTINSAVVISVVVESSRCSSKTLQEGSCPLCASGRGFTVCAYWRNLTFPTFPSGNFMTTIMTLLLIIIMVDSYKAHIPSKKMFVALFRFNIIIHVQ